jgi:indolepyruvate ferredoxin oxidoreductase
MLARMKGVRGTVFDPFARTPARKLERELVGWYCRLIEMAIEKLTVENHAQVIEIAELPDSIRGYEDVKEKAALAAMERGGRLVENLGPKG